MEYVQDLSGKYLKTHDCSGAEQSSKKLDTLGRENRQPEAGSIREISNWLNRKISLVQELNR